MGLGLGLGSVAKPRMRRTCGGQRVACRAVQADGVVARRRHHALIAARQQRA